MKEIATNLYQFPIQQFFGESVRTYAIEQEESIYCFDIPEDTDRNRAFLQKFHKPIRIIMSHGSTSNGFESMRESLQYRGIDVEIWLHEQDEYNTWLTIRPDILLSGEDQQLSKNITLIFTPGHTLGSVCLLVHTDEGIMLTGDTLGGTRDLDIRPFPLKTNDLAPSIFFRSLKKLLHYEFRTMYPFHYYPINNARIKLEHFIALYEPNTSSE